MKLFSRNVIALFLVLLSSAATGESAQTGVQLIFDIGYTRFFFDDGAVSGKSNHLGITLAASVKSLFEIGYTEAGTLLWNASIEEDGGYTPEDGFYTQTKLFYLRGNLTISKTFSVYGLIGHSNVEIEGTTTTACLFFCGDDFYSTTSDYIYNESGVALGAGLQWLTQNKDRVQLQYIDYIYDSDYDFSGVYLSYGWMYDLPAF